MCGQVLVRFILTLYGYIALGGYVLVKLIVKEVGGHFLSKSKQYCSVIDVPSKAQLYQIIHEFQGAPPLKQ